MKVRWLRPAMESLDRVYERIATENPAAARKVFRRIVGATRRLEEFPLSCPVGRVQGTYELVVADLPYVIVYRVVSDRVDILRVFHSAQNWSVNVN